MNLPKCSFIISVYKDTESLELILESLARQTVKPDEVIISEDGDSVEMAEYCKNAEAKFSTLPLVHLSQEDIGWRKISLSIELSWLQNMSILSLSMGIVYLIYPL